MVKMNVRVLSTTLIQTHCIPGAESHKEIELLQKLCKMGQETQDRIVDLLMVVENEDVMLS